MKPFYTGDLKCTGPQKILSPLNNTELTYPSIHVSSTNGKGSVLL